MTTNLTNSPRVFGFHYALFDQNGTLVESSRQQEPLFFLEASQQIIPGLEIEVVKMSLGEKKNIKVKAVDAYGDLRDDLVVKVSKQQLPNGMNIKIGDQFQVDEDHHSPVFIVKHIEGESVTLDGNHPMAGKDLTFEVELMFVREATQEELAHGHAHGADGKHKH